MISDHVAPTPDVAARYPAPIYDPFTTLGWLAGTTRTIELGTTVIILPYRHPVQTARVAATVDRLSGGRFIFGVGVGWSQLRVRGARRPVRAPWRRLERLSGGDQEALDQTSVASHAGPFVSFEDVHTGPRPLRSPHPPIWVGGSSDAALRRARALRRCLAPEPGADGLAEGHRSAENRGDRRRGGQAGAALSARVSGCS